MYIGNTTPPPKKRKEIKLVKGDDCCSLSNVPLTWLCPICDMISTWDFQKLSLRSLNAHL